MSLGSHHVYVHHSVIRYSSRIYMHIIGYPSCICMSFGTFHVYARPLVTLHVYTCHWIPVTYMHVIWYFSRVCMSLSTRHVHACHWVPYTCMLVIRYPINNWTGDHFVCGGG